MKRILYILLLVIFAGCSRNDSKTKGVSLADVPERSMHIKYATGFKVDYFQKYSRITLYDPWKSGKVFARYYLIEDSTVFTPKDGIRVLIPLKTIVAASCTHYTFLEMLGELNTVTGICNAKSAYNPFIRSAYKSGRIVDLGDPFQMNVEQCLLLKPQALMVTGYNQQDEHIKRLSESGIPIIYNNEWMEPTLLARAEWVRFVACFYKKEILSDSLFKNVESNYIRLKKIASKSVTLNPIVLSGDNFRGTWYLPGGKSFTAQLFSDAGGNYIYKNDKTSGSLSYSFEQVLRDLNNADIWVGVTNGKTLSELKHVDERYGLFKPFRNGKVYSYFNRVTPDGGNDYWESSVAYPDRLLADFIKLFHPELLPDYSWFYLKKLN